MMSFDFDIPPKKEKPTKERRKQKQKPTKQDKKELSQTTGEKKKKQHKTKGTREGESPPNEAKRSPTRTRGRTREPSTQEQIHHISYIK